MHLQCRFSDWTFVLELRLEDRIGDAGRHAPLSSIGLGLTESSADASL